MIGLFQAKKAENQIQRKKLVLCLFYLSTVVKYKGKNGKNILEYFFLFKISQLVLENDLFLIARTGPHFRIHQMINWSQVYVFAFNHKLSGSSLLELT